VADAHISDVIWTGIGLYGAEVFTPIPDQCSNFHQLSIAYMVWGMVLMW
jgi:hypothetical protein